MSREPLPVLAAEQPHFFLHSGDTVYANRIVLPRVTLDDGSLWNNLGNSREK